MSNTIAIEKAVQGDIILFAGSDNNLSAIQHMGIITSNEDKLNFIHASSSHGVMISDLNAYFKPRLIKIVRITK